jgi:hypothetical protein
MTFVPLNTTLKLSLPRPAPCVPFVITKMGTEESVVTTG